MAEPITLLAEALAFSAHLASPLRNILKRRRRKRQARALKEALLACGVLAVLLWAGRNA